MYRTNGELYNMFFMFAQCDGNSRLAAQRYKEKYHPLNPPSAKSFRHLANRLYTVGYLQPTRMEVGHSTRSIAALKVDEFNRESTSSIRECDHMLNRSAIYRMIEEYEMQSQKCTHLQNFRPEDYVRRLKYSKWLLREIERNPSFCKYILWSDEALFTVDGCFETHNSNFWDNEYRPLTVRKCESINLWAGICGDYIVGPYILPDKLNASKYKIFLEDVLPNLLEEIPLEIRKNMYFQIDGAPVHYNSSVKAYLDQIFENSWIGRGGTVSWPSRSTDMNPMDFFFWPHVQNEIIHHPVLSLNDLVTRIHSAVAKITPEMLRNLQNRIRLNALACVEAQGGHIGPVLC